MNEEATREELIKEAIELIKRATDEQIKTALKITLGIEI